MMIIVEIVDSYLFCIKFDSNYTSHLKYLNNSNGKAWPSHYVKVYSKTEKEVKKWKK